eukprot:scaffold57120_cov29-Tisochrysis_lutea.AAC.4
MKEACRVHKRADVAAKLGVDEMKDGAHCLLPPLLRRQVAPNRPHSHRVRSRELSDCCIRSLFIVA